jgi:uncharacterized protein YciU (UPF0263 family)
MITGVETAGLVLGSIPIILAGLEYYAKGIAVSQRYWKFQLVCKNLCHVLRTEETMCRNSLQNLLIGVVQEKNMEAFLNDPRGERWKEPKFEKKLKDRLGPAYDIYIGTINQMKEITDIFLSKLELDDSGKAPLKNKRTIKEHYKRLKFSLQKDTYDDLIARLKEANTALDRMTTQTISIENRKSLRKAERKAVPNFKVIQAYAASCYSALSTGWKCPCLAGHTVSLRLECRDCSSDEDEDEESVTSPFHVVFRNRVSSHLRGNGDSSPPWTWEEADVHVVRQIQDSDISTSCAVKGVRFEAKAKKVVKAALNPNPNLKPIQDLCAAISNLQKPERDECLSLLATEYAKQKYGIHIYPVKERPPNPATWTITSLRSALGDTDLSWSKRLNLAVILASSVLQLHKTPWLDDHWSVDNIFFVARGHDIVYQHPFISQRFNDIEAQSEKQYIPPVLRMVIKNKSLYALGILLIELKYKICIRELHIPKDGPLSDDPVTAVLTEWNTADRLVDRLYDEVGRFYGDAVRRCIRCDFDHKSSSLDDVPFQKAVYQGVVALLVQNYDSLFAPEFDG